MYCSLKDFPDTEKTVFTCVCKASYDISYEEHFPLCHVLSSTKQAVTCVDNVHPHVEEEFAGHLICEKENKMYILDPFTVSLGKYPLAIMESLVLHWTTFLKTPKKINLDQLLNMHTHYAILRENGVQFHNAVGKIAKMYGLLINPFPELTRFENVLVPIGSFFSSDARIRCIFESTHAYKILCISPETGTRFFVHFP